MTPQAEEAARMLRLAMRDQSAFHALLNSVGVPSAVAFFHAQQSVEKALKSAMCLRGLEYRRTHDLEELAGQLKDAGAAPPISIDDLMRLTPYAVEYRYDDQAPELLTAEAGRSLVSAVIAWAQGFLPSEDAS